MSPDQADQRLPIATNGSPIVTLMTDPDLARDGFLSIVDKGANGRRFQVVKAEDMPKKPDEDEKKGLHGSEDEKKPIAKAEDLQPITEITLDLGQTSGSMSWWRQLWGPLLSGGVQKSEAVSFDEALVVPKVFDRLYNGFDALLQSIASILDDESVPDKQAAIDMQLSKFAIWVSDAFNIPVLKADQQARVSAVTRQVWDQIVARKQADRLQGAEASAIFAAQKAIEQAGAALSTLAAKSASTASVTPTSEDSVNPAQLQAVAAAAADTAIKVAKAANPSATPAELQAIGVAASTDVYKMAVMGPKQPGLPANNLAMQLAMAQDSGMAKEPLGQILQAINRLTSLTSKNYRALHGDADEQGNVPENGDPGLLGVVAQVVKTQAEMGTRVQKMERTPAPSRQTTEQPSVVVRKAATDDDVWKGSAFDLSA